MTQNPLVHPITMDRTRIMLLPQHLGIRHLAVDPSYWSTMSKRPELANGRVLSVFDYHENWTWWERHPLGDELAYLIAGEIELLLETGEDKWSVTLAPGSAAIVPRGAWHSARVSKPTQVLFVTPTPAKTQHRDI